MKIAAEEKVAMFQKELDLIYDESIKEFAKLCLIAAPDYIFIDCPASSTGKYHPLDELGSDGTVLHMKKIVTLAYELCRGLACEHNRDEILAACLIHDLRKKGINNSQHTLKNHPNLAAQLVEEVQNATGILSESSFQIIRNCCGYHYGPWSSNPWIKDIKEYTLEELTVYIADYVVSKRFVKINYRR